MAKLSREQVAAYLTDAGVSGQELAKLVGIAGRESGYKSDAHRTDSDPSKLSGDRGLWQINYIWDDQLKQAGIINSAKDLFDPATNAKAAAYVLSKQGWPAWGAGSGGWTQGGNELHGVDMGAANQAVSNYHASPEQYHSGRAPTSASSELQAAEREPVVAPVRNTEYDYKYETPEIDPAQQKALTTLLEGFGVDYPEAPRANAQLLTFLRGIGMSRDVAEDALMSTQGQLRRDAADSRMDVDRLDRRQRKGIINDAESRGAVSSGATNTGFAEQAEDTADRVYGIEQNLASGLENAQTGFNTIEDSLRQQALEKTLGVETQQAEQEAAGREKERQFNASREESDYQAAQRLAAEERLRQEQIDLYNKYGV